MLIFHKFSASCDHCFHKISASRKLSARFPQVTMMAMMMMMELITTTSMLLTLMLIIADGTDNDDIDADKFNYKAYRARILYTSRFRERAAA